MASERPPARAVRLPALWVLIAGLHIAAALYAWHLLPHGFGATRPRFWINQVLPFALTAAGAVCLFAIWRLSLIHI